MQVQVKEPLTVEIVEVDEVGQLLLDAADNMVLHGWKPGVCMDGNAMGPGCTVSTINRTARSQGLQPLHVSGGLADKATKRLQSMLGPTTQIPSWSDAGPAEKVIEGLRKAATHGC